MKVKKNSIQYISAQTGFSVSTVSRVLSGKAGLSRISGKTVEIIQAEAKRVNYTPNLLAQGLRTSHTSTIGLTVPSVENPFFATLAGIVIEKLHEAGYHTFLVDSREDEEDFIEALMMFRSRSVDGIIAVPVNGTESPLLAQISEDVPIVLVDRYYEGTTLPYICTDNHEGGLMATEYLISHGFRRILSIQGVVDSSPSKARVQGFLDAVASHPELDIATAIVGDAFSVENGYGQVKSIFADWKAKGKPFDSVFAYSSTILLGAIQAFRELGLRIPDDVGIISFDNNSFLDFLDPAVTRIQQPLEEIGKLAVEVLLDRIANGVPESPVQRLISPSLVVRKSC